MARLLHGAESVDNGLDREEGLRQWLQLLLGKRAPQCTEHGRKEIGLGSADFR